MSYVKENQAKKCVIGISVKTSNEHFQKEVLPLRDKFLHEKLAEKIPNRLNQSILCVYTDYEGDHTKPFTWLIGCEVSDLKVIPEGMVGVEIPASSYAVFTAAGSFPESMMVAWTSIWKSDVKRSYTTDFEVYSPDFDPQKNPKVKIYIAAHSMMMPR
jgi:predicted transcriptional regulator YdeE